MPSPQATPSPPRASTTTTLQSMAEEVCACAVEVEGGTVSVKAGVKRDA